MPFDCILDIKYFRKPFFHVQGNAEVEMIDLIQICPIRVKNLGIIKDLLIFQNAVFYMNPPGP